MTHPAFAPSAFPTMEYGLVASRHGQEFTVLAGQGRYTARRAKSCLLAPEVGDSVLLCSDDLGRCFILAVLEGATEESTLEFQGDLALRVKDGNLNLAAEQDIAMASDTFSLTAREGQATVGRFSLLGESLKTQCRKLVLAADACEQSLRSLTQRLGSFFRATEGHQEVQAASARTLVEDTHVLHCKNSVLMAEEDARIDAEQIQLG